MVAKIFVVVGQWKQMNNISARVAFSRKEDAQAWIDDPKRNWSDDRTEIVEIDLDPK